MTQDEIQAAHAPGTAAQTLQEWLNEAGRLRYTKIPASGAAPQEIREALLTARANLDRLEVLYSFGLAQRGGFRVRARAAEEAADDNWDRLAATANQQGRGARDFEGSRERYARFNLDNFEARREARMWRQAAEIAEQGCDQLRLAYYGLRDTVMDLREALRSFTLESSLDR